MTRIILIALAIAGLSACTTTIPRHSASEIRVQYGMVDRISRVPVDSAVPAGAIAGGMIGLILSHKQSTGKRAASTLGGAVLGGAAAKVLEGDNRAFQYHLTLNDGTKTSFVTEKDFLIRGDCVAVERGRYANLRRVEATMCEAKPEVKAFHVENANQCHSAKNQLLIAQTDREIAVASQKVETLCQYSR